MSSCEVNSTTCSTLNFRASSLQPESSPLSYDSQSYENVNIVKLLSKAKFPVYQAHSPTKNKHFALKVFRFMDKNPHPYFKNEARFSFLNHPNIIHIAHVEEEISVCSKGKNKQVSCILMEYAPHGDFFDLIKKYKKDINEKLVRTYFKQLIEGLQYLHENGVYHLDLKLENLLLGKDYEMKIADFDLSYIEGDSKVLTRGTRFYRAPELRASKCRDGMAADIYAAGIILFVMKSGGVIPHAEDNLYQGINLLELLNTDSQGFFKKHCEIQGKDWTFFDSGFKELFTKMIKNDPNERATISDIKNSNWYKGSTYSKEELKKRVHKFFQH